MPSVNRGKGIPPTEDYGVIGNMRSIALVSVEGSIDFLCFPDFDSPTIFAALLDAERGGSFALNPDLAHMRVKQLYLPDTNILLTRFLSESGVAEVTDFMPVVEDKDKQRCGHHIIRMLRVIKGQVRFEMHCAPRFNYARSGHKAQRDQGAICFIPDCPDCPRMTLHTTFPVHVDGSDAKASFTLNAGETAMIAFGKVDEEEKTPGAMLDPGNVEEHFQKTARFWRAWISRSNYTGRWREMVNRSAVQHSPKSSAPDRSRYSPKTYGQRSTRLTKTAVGIQGTRLSVNAGFSRMVRAGTHTLLMSERLDRIDPARATGR